jgi:hypothetical protein
VRELQAAQPSPDVHIHPPPIARSEVPTGKSASPDPNGERPGSRL